MLLTYVDNCSLTQCINNVNYNCVLNGVEIEISEDNFMFKYGINSSSECKINKAIKLHKTQNLILGK